MCTAKAFQEEMELQSPAFLGILRVVKLEDKHGQSGKDTFTDVDQIKRKNLLDNMWRVCDKFKAIFPKDLPKGVPPIRMGHEFKIDFEPNTVPYPPAYLQTQCVRATESKDN